MAAPFCYRVGVTTIAAAIGLLCPVMNPATAAEDLLPASFKSGLLSAEGVQKIDAMLDEEVVKGNIAGALLMVQAGGKPIYYRSFGYRDPQTHTPMTADAIFRLYSMTKPVTSVAAMMLIEDGKLALDDPIAKFIPAFASMKVGIQRTRSDGTRWLDLVPADRPITVLDLMRQSSGITSAFDNLGLVTDIFLKSDLFEGDFDNREFVERLAKLPLAYQPETVWDYGHSTDVLGRIVEIASGKSLYEFERQRLFDPLEMNDTSYYVTDRDKQARIAQPLPHERVIGNEPISDPTFVRRWEAGGSGLVSTTRDYARFIQMIVNNGVLDGRRYLSAESVGTMLRDEVAPATNIRPWAYYYPGAGFGYGLGFAVRTGPGSDGVPGYLGEIAWGGAAGTYFWAYPKQDLVMLFMVQTPSQRGRIQPILKSLVFNAIKK